jgi:thymidine kinase
MQFTFIMMYRGGTYVSQVESKTILNACKKWVKNLKIDEIEFFSEKIRVKLLAEVTDKDNRPVKLTGLRNVFFTDAILGKYMADIYIISTKL